MNRVFVLLSSNHDPEKNLPAGLALLQEKSRVEAISSVYESAPVGEGYQANFLDAVAELRTNLCPSEFRNDILGQIEQRLGRERPGMQAGFHVITIDLDILLWNQESFDFGPKPWHVPDRKIVREAHLAVPLAELAPDYVHPEDGRTLLKIAKSLPHEGLTLRQDIRLDLSRPLLKS